jgi:hypothetical protein
MLRTLIELHIQYTDNMHILTANKTFICTGLSDVYCVYLPMTKLNVQNNCQIALKIQKEASF